ncbi:MAG: hypoxanthine phosphoribosyltransferase [Deltaproteobacteria bacterium]|nr:hypoxanthine phosphoribosyltransferase [Deltaproteobacteria bacterium]
MEPNLKPILTPEEIEKTVERIAGEIEADYASKDPLLIGVLKGAVIFLSDLLRAVKMPLDADFVQTTCYGKRDTPSSEVIVTRDISVEIKGRDIIIVEGIIDRGHTARALIEYFGTKGPSSIRLCTLLMRKSTPADIKADYVGIRIGEGFIVGYGMDYKEHYRGLRGLYVLAPEK